MSSRESRSPVELVRFFRTVGNLKRISRRGWELRGVPHPESVADHAFRTAMLALALPAPQGLDRHRCVAMALAHDLAESTVGDITPYDGVSREDKLARERAAMVELTGWLDGDELLELWTEFEDGTTPESRFVRDLDIAETILQAREYRGSTEESLAEFWERGRDRLTTDTVRRFVDAVLAEP